MTKKTGARASRWHLLSAAVGVTTAWAALAFVIYAPWDFGPSWLPFELPLFGLAAAWAAHRSPRLLRSLLPLRYREAATHREAERLFTVETVHGTRARTGVLIYVAALEDLVAVMPDGGVAALVPPGELNAVRWGDGADPRAPGDLAHFLAGLHRLGDLLARHLPASDDNPNEISDTPRVIR